uniref:Uncharacterized protein LOC113790481 n=1 Tax=Dermatophagoides pteronyssinus TaxID=6956 RepID=A0A6P6XR54_DERPT
MYIVKVQFTDLDSYPNITLNFDDCDLHLKHQSEEHGECRGSTSNDGSDYRFIIKTYPRCKTIREWNPQSLLVDFDEGTIKAIPFNTILDLIFTLKEKTIEIFLDQHAIQYRLEFTDKNDVKSLLNLIQNELPWFTWDEILSNPIDDYYVLKNSILWEKKFNNISPIQSSQSPASSSSSSSSSSSEKSMEKENPDDD